MAIYVANDVAAWLGSMEISPRMNKLTLEYGADMVEKTQFGADTHVHVAGLKNAKAMLEGFVDLADDDIDERLFDLMGLADQVFSCSPDGGDEGEIAFAILVAGGQYAPGASIGELLAYTAEAGASRGSAGLVRGLVMHNATRTSSASGTARQLGAVSATQKLYASLHVLSVAGTLPTLDVIVASDNAEAFSTGTTRITFGQKAAIGSEWATPVPGSITDDWWRIGWTIGGSGGPGFGFVVVVGIQ